jgi:hypothetical protein
MSRVIRTQEEEVTLSASLPSTPMDKQAFSKLFIRLWVLHGSGRSDHKKCVGYQFFTVCRD